MKVDDLRLRIEETSKVKEENEREAQKVIIEQEASI